MTKTKDRVTVTIDIGTLVKLDQICEKYQKKRSQLVQRCVKRLVDGVEDLEDVVTEQFLVAGKEGSKR